MKLILAQYILLIPVIILILSSIQKYHKKNIQTITLIGTLFFWFLIATIIVFPNITQIAANFVGIGRGVDLVVYLTLIAIIMVLVQVISRNIELEQKITQLARHMALKDANEPLASVKNVDVAANDNNQN